MGNQLAKIRDEIAQTGETTITCAELPAICPEAVLASGKWNAIAAIAMRECWSFTLHPNGDVSFAPLESAT
jgi:hypothetical protein